MKIAYEGTPSCCGAYVLYGFECDYSYNTGDLYGKVKDYDAKVKQAEEDVKSILNALKDRSFMLVYLNAPQQLVYEKMLLKLGFTVLAEAENIPYFATSPIKMYGFIYNTPFRFHAEAKKKYLEEAKKGWEPSKYSITSPKPFPTGDTIKW